MPRSLPLLALSAAALLAGVFPTVMFGDDGELVRAVWGLGAAHPPGIPTYLLLAKPLTILPLGPIAMRVHLASVLAALAALWLVRLLALRWGSGTHGALFAAVAFLAAPITWQQSRLARAYPFLAVATLATMLLADRLLDRGSYDRRVLLLLSFVASLGISVHQLMAVPLAAALLVVAVRRPTGTLTAAALIPVGLLPYLALPLRGAGDPRAPGWGTIATWRDLTAHLLQREYAGKVAGGADSFLSLAGTIVGSIPREMTLPLLLLAVAGLALLISRRLPSALFLLAVVGGTMALRATYSGAGEIGPDAYRVIVRYLLGPLALLCVLAGVGWGILLRLAGERHRPGTFSLATLLTLLAAIAVFARPANTTSAETPWLWHDHARGTLLSAPAGGVILVGGDDILFPIWYLQGIGGYVPDRLAISVDGFGRPWYRRETALAASRLAHLSPGTVADAGDAESLAAAVVSGGAALAAAMLPPGAAPGQAMELATPAGRWIARGLAYRLLPPDDPAWLPRPGVPWRSIPVREPRLKAPTESLVPLSQISWFLTVAARGASSAGRPAEALPLLFRASALDPGNAVIHNDTGLALMALGLRAPAAEAFRSALSLRPDDPAIVRNLAVAQTPPGGTAPQKEELR